MDIDALVTWVGDDFPSPLCAIVARIASPYEPEITVEQGWWLLLVRLDAQLAAINPDHRIRRIQHRAGRLRFEIDETAPSDDTLAAIKYAEKEAARTCEVCGQPASPCTSGHALDWVLCAHHSGSK